VTVQGEADLPAARPADDAKDAKGGARDGKGGAAPPLHVPFLRTLGTNRERGQVAVEGVANAEVQEAQVDGLQPIDPKELPPEMQSTVSSPLLSYKYLDPRGLHLSLRVTKHEDTEVLVTAIDEGHFETTVAQEGKVLTRCLLKVRNTQRQFLRLALPEGATIWSTLVGNAAIKPGVDPSGQYMIALRQSGAKQPDEEFIVELLYLTETSRVASLAGASLAGMSGRGQLELTFPRFDIPINHLFVTTRLPTNFKYGEFKGTLTEVKKFSRSPRVQPGRWHQGVPVKACKSQLHSSMQPAMQRRGNPLNGHRAMERSASFERHRGVRTMHNCPHLDPAAEAADGDNVSVDLYLNDLDGARGGVDSEAHGAYDPSRGVVGAPVGAKKAGVTPVRVELPLAGRSFYFEKLIVVTEPLAVTVRYKEKRKSFFARRSVW